MKHVSKGARAGPKLKMTPAPLSRTQPKWVKLTLMIKPLVIMTQVIFFN
jgi:hypothetical protein